MTAKIRILPEQLTNKIAAGEVVERPASVVKELVENSLDAGATEIIVEIEDGGRRLIRVADNGCGMSRDDLLLSMERHATSKISSDADLFRITSLGFRGEALPSIASVSRFNLASREAGSIEGTEVYAEGGKIIDVKSCGMPSGTVVSVRNLFFNTPARLKFMKTRETETGHVGEIINRLALSRPDVRFIYSVDGKESCRLPAGGLGARVKEIFGADLANELSNLSFNGDGVTIEGMAGSPSASRSTAGHIYTFINGRYVKDRVVQHAVMQGYKNVMERGRYPVLVLSINLASGDVDVNVHPTKHEVRFRDQTKMHGAIQGAIEAHLQSASPFRPGGVPLQPRQYSPASVQAVSRVNEVKDSLLRYVAANQSAARDNVFRSYPDSFVGESRQSDGTSVSNPPSDEVAEEGHLSVKIIGQFRSAYLVCEEGNDLLIIDQHAAHERVVFQELRDSFRSGAIDGQNLLFPETITLSPIEHETLREHMPLLLKFAFEFEEFGRNSWLLRSIPLVLAGQDYRQALLDILSELAGLGVSSLIDDKIDEILARVACHSVVRGEWHLSSTEIAGLLNRMSQTTFAANCPHGRPVVARIGLRDLEKMFKR